jgi:hypothetical protein
MLTVSVAILGALPLAACHDRAEPAPHPAPLTDATTPDSTPPSSAAARTNDQPELGPHRSPVTVKLLGPEQVSAGQDIEVVAEVNQFVGSSAAVELRLNLPEGAHLVSGSPTEQLPAGNGKLVRHFIVHLDRVPARDIEVVATTSSTAFGARAQSAYRFGRPEPRFADPQRADRPLIVGGKNVGKPIQLKP